MINQMLSRQNPQPYKKYLGVLFTIRTRVQYLA